MKKHTVKELEQKVAELTEALQRERADAVNLRRRYESQIAELKTHLKVDVIKELLPVIDNFDRALGHVPADLENSDFAKGVSGIAKQFEKTLKALGVERIKTVGEVFNPELHEAVSMEDGEGDHEIVSEELQPGYAIQGQVIRAAMVRVKQVRSDENTEAAKKKS